MFWFIQLLHTALSAKWFPNVTLSVAANVWTQFRTKDQPHTTKSAHVLKHHMKSRIRSNSALYECVLYKERSYLIRKKITTKSPDERRQTASDTDCTAVNVILTINVRMSACFWVDNKSYYYYVYLHCSMQHHQAADKVYNKQCRSLTNNFCTFHRICYRAQFILSPLFGMEQCDLWQRCELNEFYWTNE